MKYFEFTFHTSPCTETVNDVLAAVLGEAGFESFVESEGGLTAYIQQALCDENTIKNEVSDNKTTVIGKEEQESSKENTSMSDEQKAIEIAKNEWAISVDSYDYRAELQSDGTYVVRVIGKTDRNEVTRYIVNVKTGVATEVQ